MTSSRSRQGETDRREKYSSLYQEVRHSTEVLCQPLTIEDHVIQSMPDASPTRWHLAHTSWFFEAFLLEKEDPHYRSPDPRYSYLFNSYYVQVGERFPRPDRGLLSRPTVEQIYDYRHHVDSAMVRLIGECSGDRMEKIGPLIELGLNHEQQHQELILTDIKHAFSLNPLQPAYAPTDSLPGGSGSGQTDHTHAQSVPVHRWVHFEGGEYVIGHEGSGFAFDNESPRHSILLPPFRIGNRPITNREYLLFIQDGGYDRPELWLSDGARAAEEHKWKSPAFWQYEDGKWNQFTLRGLTDLELDEPVCHVSFFEADAFARWAGERLLTEAEWEIAARDRPVAGNFADSGLLHPRPLREDSKDEPDGLFGDVWEWTGSPYTPYPGFRPAPGAIGEYNGKFMINQMVLRGGSCVTPPGHIRPTYRNFFFPEARWQFTGIRLAGDD